MPEESRLMEPPDGKLLLEYTLPPWSVAGRHFVTEAVFTNWDEQNRNSSLDCIQ